MVGDKKAIMSNVSNNLTSAIIQDKLSNSWEGGNGA